MTANDSERPPPPAKPRRHRVTSPRVRWIDRITTTVISVGGIAVILCVIGIFVYLVAVAAPLFRGAELHARETFPLVPAADVARVLSAELDEYGALGRYVLDSGEVVAFAARTGRTVSTARLFPADGPTLSAWSRSPGSPDFALGFADGSIRLARVGFTTRFLSTEDIARLGDADDGVIDGGVVERTPTGEYRRVELAVEDRGRLEPMVPGVGIALLDYRPSESITRLAILGSDGSLRLQEVEQRTNLMTGETANEVTSTPLPYTPDDDANAPSQLLLAANGQQLILAWRDGALFRYDLRDLTSPVVAERARIATPGVELTTLAFALGEQSILAGDSAGEVKSWFRVPHDNRPWTGAVTSDGHHLVPAHVFAGHGSSVTAIATSLRDKSFAATDASGAVTLYHMTSEQLLAETRIASGSPAIAVQIGPKSDAIFTLSRSGEASRWKLVNPHPETTLGSLFGPVWYEGAPTPGYTWQSSSGTDDFEPKLSLVPLIFGTLKATFYSMLFAVPVALLAAIYTSEFLDRRLRTPLKSLVEVMASLPSVVLGFLGALVLAPVIERSLVSVGLGILLVPVGAQLLGHLWQALPRNFTLPLSGRAPFALLLLVLAAAAVTASAAGPSLERFLFAGDIKAWLDGRVGAATPGWAVLLWPLSWVGLTLADRAWLLPFLSRRAAVRSAAVVARRELYKSLVVLASSIVLAWAVGSFLTGVGLDPRGGLVGTYVQRNALIVGFVMGFAVIPIVYTIAEDSLNAVPRTLRSASLGCGATPWQTATRVVLPVAMSGIFSALMIGLGRAVGETMIVLMAAGNTPVLDVNPFNGLRTLAANIAVELPEAVKEGTLYRVLFLSALTLLVFTSLVNTIAEIVRQRFRRRAFEL